MICFIWACVRIFLRSPFMLRVVPITSSETTYEDWLEFYVLEGSCTLKDYKLKVGTSIIKTFPDIQVQKGDYLVLNLGEDLQDEICKNTNGYFNLYTKLSDGLVSTDGSLILLADDNSVKDCFFYSKPNKEQCP